MVKPRDLDPKALLAAAQDSLTGKLLNIVDVEVQYRGWNKAGAWFDPPARAYFTALGTQRTSRLSMKIGLGTERPAKMLVVPSQDQSELYFIPVSDHPLAIDVSYPEGRCYINLVKLFTVLNRVLLPGRREFYPVSISEAPVKVPELNLESFALVMPLKAAEKKRVKTSKQKAKAKAQKAAKATKAEKPEKAQPSPPTTEAPQA